MNSWHAKALQFAEKLDKKLEEFDNAIDDVLSNQDRKYFDMAMRYADVTLKTGTVVKFSKYVERHKQEEKKRMNAEMYNATEAYSSKVPDVQNLLILA